MNTDNKISRRDFIKTSALTGGALLASTAIPGQAMNLLQEQKNENKFANDELLKGVCGATSTCIAARIRGSGRWMNTAL